MLSTFFRISGGTRTLYTLASLPETNPLRYILERISEFSCVQQSSWKFGHSIHRKGSWIFARELFFCNEQREIKCHTNKEGKGDDTIEYVYLSDMYEAFVYRSCKLSNNKHKCFYTRYICQVTPETRFLHKSQHCFPVSRQSSLNPSRPAQIPANQVQMGCSL